MLLNFFKRTLPGTIVAIIVLLGVLWVPSFIGSASMSVVGADPHPMPLYSLLTNNILKSGLAGSITVVLLVVVMLSLFIFFNRKDYFLNQRTFLPALFYVLLNALFPANQTLNPVLPAAIFLVLALVRIMDSYKKQGTAYNFFDAGIMIGIGSLFYSNLIWFGVILFIGILILRTANLKEMVLSVIGLITPYVFTISVYYLWDKEITTFFGFLADDLFAKKSIDTSQFTLVTIISLSFVVLTSLIALIDLFGKLNTKKNRSRKSFYLFMWMMVVPTLLLGLFKTVSTDVVWLITIPLSFFLSHYFIFTRRKVLPKILFSGIFLAVLAVQLFSYLADH